ncbi:MULTISPECIES: hypothetical protein [unclassified Streptomyces]|uniref:hypothetical protein n=1 Tax=unclassified Streptomyces TaxID=2593676 RepID=UPI002035A772|nr:MULTISPECIES: hypothetical protein [unclassified Streptomyces]
MLAGVPMGRVGFTQQALPVIRHQELLTPWIGMAVEHVIRVSAELVTGYRLER